MRKNVLYADDRLGGVTRWRLCSGEDARVIVPDEVRKCVVYIGAEISGKETWCGTGFFASRPWVSNSEARFQYLVTARHVIADLVHKHQVDEILVRLNARKGGVRVLRTKVADWRPHPDSTVDLKCYRWDRSEIDAFDMLCVPLPANAATPDNLEQLLFGLGPGDDVFVTGLFVNRAGSQRNIPIVRVGTVAAIPEEKVQWGGEEIDAYLVETHSIGGISGSPVFVHYGSSWRHRPPGVTSGGDVTFFFLGVIRGHYDDEKAAINQGIAVVTPVEKVIELFEVFGEEDRMEEDREVAQIAKSHVEDSAIPSSPQAKPAV